jgi:hypothetical protein
MFSIDLYCSEVVKRETKLANEAKKIAAENLQVQNAIKHCMKRIQLI